MLNHDVLNCSAITLFLFLTLEVFHYPALLYIVDLQAGTEIFMFELVRILDID